MDKKILIIEDEIRLLGVLSEKFSNEGFEVLRAKDGEEGLRVALDTRPDLILLDIIMPKMDGMTMLKKLRKDEWGKDVSVIILTNLSDAEKITEAWDQQVYEFLVKTQWSLEELVERVKTKLNRQIKSR